MKITIVGGGTAGWMTASYLAKKTDWNITVIQSEDIPIIGVGESTLPSMYDFITELGLTEQDLFDHCDAVRKYTICHKDCLLYTSPSPRDATLSRMPSSA